MTAITAITWVLALLLAAAGAGKLTSPGVTGAALQVARLPSSPVLVRLLGGFELLLATAVLLVGGAAPALLLAGTYGTFAIFAFRQSRRGEGCGCFGEAEAPTSNLHVVLNVTAVLTATAAAVRPGTSVLALRDEPLILIVGLALLVTATALLRLVLTSLPELRAAQALLTTEAEA